MERRIRILFISHVASLTGAPVLLLNLLKLLHAEGNYQISVLLRRGGELESDFVNSFETLILKRQDYGRSGNFLRRGIEFLTYILREALFIWFSKKPDLIFSNTVANGKLLFKLRRWKTPIVTYVHELESVIKEFDSLKESEPAFACTDLFLCPSRAVAQNLLINHRIPESRILYLKYYFPIGDHEIGNEEKFNKRSWLAEKYSVDRNAFWVVGMGTVTMRKGPDLFMKAAKKVLSAGEKVFFFWIGEHTDKVLFSDIQSQIAEDALSDRIIFTGSLPYDPSILACFDLFLLSSREDPYPLVVLEAAFHSVPAICFHQSGGIVEFVGKDAGWTVPDFSVDTMAYTIQKIIHDPIERKTMANNALEKVKILHGNGKEIIREFNHAVVTAITK